MTGPGAAWPDLTPAERVKAYRERLTPAELDGDVPHGAEQRPGRVQQYADHLRAASAARHEQAEQPRGRSRQRGVRRVGRDVTMDGPVVERVERLAELEHGGNYSAALQRVVEAGLATMDAAARMRAAGVELDELLGPAPCPWCGSDEHIGGNCPRVD